MQDDIFEFDILDEEANEGKLDKDLVAIAKELYLN